MNIYDQVRWNKAKSYLIMSLFIIFISFLGWIIGLVYGSAWFGLIFAFIGAFIYSLVAYFQGENIILRTTGAREVTKQEFPYLFHTIEGLAIAANIPTPKAYVIDDPALNAFATGKTPNNSSITVTTGLLKKLDRQEIEGVVAHEMSHIKNYDIRMMLLTTVMIGIIILMSDVLLNTFLWSRRDNDNNQMAIIFIIIGVLLAILSPLIAQLIQLAISRKREYLADANGALLTRNPDGLANALEKISINPDVKKANKATAHLFISSPFKNAKGFLTNLFSTHPPIEDRIKKLRAI
jgi:heat shock protein HtpX